MRTRHTPLGRVLDAETHPSTANALGPELHHTEVVAGGDVGFIYLLIDLTDHSLPEL